MLCINKTVLNKVFDDEGFMNEIKAFLNSVADSELDKPENEIDFDLIDGCAAAIIEIESGSPDKAVYSLLSSEAFAKKVRSAGRGLSVTVRIGLIAALLVLSTITVNATVGSVTGSSIVENIASAVSESNEEKKQKKDKKETTVQSSTVVSETAKPTQPDEKTTAKAAELTDKSVLISKGGMPKDSRPVLCREYYDSNDEVHCSFKRISPSLGKEVSYKQEYTEKVTNSNTSFDESKYKKEKCRNSVCNEETGELHDFSEWFETQPPTCTALGSQQRYCKVCGLQQNCPVKATGVHSFSVSSVDRTCADSKNWRKNENLDGTIRYVCKICGKKEKKTISAASYVVVDRYEFEYDGKVHHPKIIAVLDKNKRVIPKSEYTCFYFDGEGKGKDIYNDYGAYAEVRSYYQGVDVGLRYYYIPDTVKFTSILTGNGTIVPTWQKAKFCENVDRPIYEIQYATDSSFSDAKTVKAYDGATKIVISNVTKGKTYYVRIRGVSDFSRYSTIPKGYWSDVRAVTAE